MIRQRRGQEGRRVHKVWMKFLSLLLASVVAGCSSSVRQKAAEYDPSVHFGAYRTYAWTGDGLRAGASDVEMLDWRVHKAVDSQLASKGYVRQSATATADFLVRYRVKIEEAMVDSFRDYFAYRGAGGTGSPQEAFTHGFEEATLILEFFDGKTRQLGWRGRAVAVVHPKASENQNERVNKAVAQMLKGFPP